MLNQTFKPEKNSIINFLNERPKWYQKIKLPYGLETPGKDRSELADKIFPPDFMGATVLDVGCAEGFFCTEAIKRNATKVVGLDINEERLKTAKKVSEFLNYEIEYINANITKIEDIGKFDYIIGLNLLHHVKNPIHVLRTLNNNTKDKLILEIADLRIKSSEIGKIFWRLLFRIMPSSFKPAVFMIDSKGKTLLTRNWIKNFFANTFCDIEKLEFLKSDRRNRYIVICHKRKVNSIRIITGPSGVGKSHFIKTFVQSPGSTNNILDFKIDNDWLLINAQNIEKYKKNINKLLLHYDMTRPTKRGYSSFNFEPALSILGSTQDKKSYVLFCNRVELIKRIKKVLGLNPKSRHIDRANYLINQYSDPIKISRIYRNWIDFCHCNNCPVEYVDVSSNTPRIVDKEHAFRLLK